MVWVLCFVREKEKFMHDSEFLSLLVKLYIVLPKNYCIVGSHPPTQSRGTPNFFWTLNVSSEESSLILSKGACVLQFTTRKLLGCTKY